MLNAQHIQARVSTTAGDFSYIESSLPADVTIAEYRRLRQRRLPLWKRLAVMSLVTR